MTILDFAAMIKIFLNSILAVAMAASANLAAADAPTNDNVADAIALEGSAFVTSGDLSKASVELDEPLPHEMTRTAWWKWTSPSSAWTTVSTGGSRCDTALAVYRGAPSPTKEIYANETVVTNDDDLQRGADFASVYFFAEAGVTYYFQVGTKGETGCEVSLAFWNVDRPAILVSDFCINPSPVFGNPATSTALAVTFHAESPKPIDRGTFLLYQPDGNLVGSIVFDGEALIKGDSFSGEYLVVFNLPPQAPPGFYRPMLSLESWSTGDYCLTEYGYLKDTAFPPSKCPAGVVVTPMGAWDDACPELTTFSLSSLSANVTNAADTLTLTVCLRDSAGLRSAQLRVYSPAGALFFQRELTDLPTNSSTEPCWDVPITFPHRAPTGGWAIQLYLADNLGNDCVMLGDLLPFPVIKVDGSSDLYENWAFNNGLIPGPSGYNDDSDRDGVSNLLEYAFGGNPNAATTCVSGDGSTLGVPSITTYAGFLNAAYAVVLPKIVNDPGVFYTLQVSEDLLSWEDVDPAILSEEAIITNGNFNVGRIITTSAIPSSSGRKFIRVKVNRFK
jgi:hypothetical protein